MKTLEQIKNEVAVDYGYEDYDEMERNILFEGSDTEHMPAFDAIAKIYAQQACEDLRERIAETDVTLSNGYKFTFHKEGKEIIRNTKIVLP